MPRGRPRKSTIATDQEERKPISVSVLDVAETIEDDERALLSKLSRKYKDENSGERVPGKKVKGQKTPWTYKDMCERFEIVAFIPDETIPLNWNGVKVQAFSGIEMHVPKPFYELYNSHKAALRPQKAPPGIVVELGAGALPNEM